MATKKKAPAAPAPTVIETPIETPAPKAPTKAPTKAQAVTKALQAKQAEQEQIRLAAERAAQEYTRCKAGEGERAIYKGAETRGEDAKCQLAPAASWDNPRAQAIKYAGFMAVAGKLPTDWVTVKQMGNVYVSLGKFSSQHSFEQGLNRLLRGHAMERSAQGLVRIHTYAIERATEDTKAGLNPYKA